MDVDNKRSGVAHTEELSYEHCCYQRLRVDIYRERHDYCLTRRNTRQSSCWHHPECNVTFKLLFLSAVVKEFLDILDKDFYELNSVNEFNISDCSRAHSS